MDPNSFLMGAGGDYIKFGQVGVVQTGRILGLSMTQQSDINTKDPKVWPDGKPMMQLIVKLQTDQFNPMNPADTGIRDLYVKGRNLTNAVRDAVKAASATGLAEGGTLQVCYIGDDLSSKAPIKPKVYQARYTPPTVPVPAAAPAGMAAAAVNWDSPAPAQAAPVAAAHHEQGPPPAWAQEPAPAPVSPAPAMSTLNAIKAAQADPTLSNQHQPNRATPSVSDPYGDEPPF